MGAPIFALVAQWIEQRISNSLVVGSIPTGCANIFMNINITATRDLLDSYWYSDRLLICNKAVSAFLGKNPEQITLSLTEEKPNSKSVKVIPSTYADVLILESDINNIYIKNEYCIIYLKLMELIKDNFNGEACWLSITETQN